MVIWVLGATGRIGRAVADRLTARGAGVVLVGRNRARLADLASGRRVVAAGSAAEIAAAIAHERPAVVVNLLGDYAATAPLLARAGLPGGHYVDAAADFAAVSGLLGLSAEAASAGSTLITGAGFGVLATEAVVAELCRDKPTPDAVRVDALGSVAMEAGILGAAFATAVVDGVTAGQRRYVRGELVATRLNPGVFAHGLPDGQSVTSGAASTGELVAARCASNAPNVVATSGLAPTSPAVRALLPAGAKLLAVPALRRLAVRRLAATRLRATPRPREHSWGHAVVTWPDGTTREGWLRAGDGMDFTADVLAETAVRLARGEAAPGAHTPAAAFGPQLAVAAGAALLIES